MHTAEETKKETTGLPEEKLINIGEMSMAEYLEIRAKEYGFNSYAELKGTENTDR